MRFGARVGLALAGLALVVFFIALRLSYKATDGDEDPHENINEDPAARLLMASGSSGDGQSNGPSPARISVSVAIVMLVSLLSVALLITGIIVVAITVDPNASSSAECSDIEEEDDERETENYYPVSPTRHLLSFSMPHPRPASFRGAILTVSSFRMLRKTCQAGKLKFNGFHVFFLSSKRL
ncbi:unnamed protein product, partial [Mesorhabditis spiculigera]